MPTRPKTDVVAKFTKEWALPVAATLGSSVRAKGIFLEVRAHLPSDRKQLIHRDAGRLALCVREGSEDAFRSVSVIVSAHWKALKTCP
jgi:hypothetical protein